MSLKYVRLYLNSGIAAENMMVIEVYTHVPQNIPRGPVSGMLWYNNSVFKIYNTTVNRSEFVTLSGLMREKNLGS